MKHYKLYVDDEEISYLLTVLAEGRVVHYNPIQGWWSIGWENDIKIVGWDGIIAQGKTLKEAYEATQK